MDQARENSVRGTKRAAGQDAVEGGKRRAPYALRACDICRRRKGKCDGRNPCRYCTGRALNCCYSSGDDWRTNTAASAPESGAADNTVASPSKNDNAWNSNVPNTIDELVVSLQGQLNNLAARVRQSSAGSVSASSLPSLASHGDDSNTDPPSTVMDPVPEEAPQQPTRPPVAAKETAHRFYGPTSPDYSLNVAQIRMRQASFSNSKSDRPSLPSIDDSQLGDEGISAGDRDDDDPLLAISGLGKRAFLQKLLYFQTILPMRETVRLLFVYQEVIGDIHPIFNIEHVVEQVEVCYKAAGACESRGPKGTGFDGPIDVNGILIANIALCTALCADSSSRPGAEEEIYSSCRDVIHSILALPVATIKHAIITLLVGVYHFFKDMPQISWRMSGIAGRMLMELGLHNRDVSAYVLGSEQQREEIITLTCSILVLDRQWSSATGLPSNFQDIPFDPSLSSAAKTPYLKAMIAFTLVSDQFNEPSSRVATGGSYEDDDDFEVMNFQIEQWRRKSIDKYDFSQPGNWQAAPSTRPPWWTIVLYLRANSVRGVLLRPFFFRGAATEASKRSIRPGLDLVSDSINILFTIDRTTDIYRKQHPHFQHLLASSCALLFLIIAYIEQNRAALSAYLPEDFATGVRSNFKKAFTLAAAYCNSSRASRRLRNRLLLVTEPLSRLGILTRTDMTGDDIIQGTATSSHQPAGINGAKDPRFSGAVTTPVNGGVDWLFPVPVTYTADMMAMPSTTVDSTNVGWAGAGGELYDWPWNEFNNNFFSDRGF